MRRKYPYESQVIEEWGPDWRLLFMESWQRQPWYLKAYFTLTRRHLWRMVRGIEDSS